MQALCTTHEKFGNLTCHPWMPKPDVGEIVTVIGEKVFDVGLDCYLLAEYTSPDPNYIWGYDKRNFSILPGIDESELVNEKEEVYA